MKAFVTDVAGQLSLLYFYTITLSPLPTHIDRLSRDNESLTMM